MDGERDQVRRRIDQRLDNLTVEQLVAVETYLSTELTRADGSKSVQVRDWPHAPLHRVTEKGTYLVTAGTLNKEHIFRGKQRLDLLEQTLLAFAKQYGWQLEAWAVFSNHYHFVGHRSLESAELKTFLGHLHGDTARGVNELDQLIGRQVWYNFWDTQLTYEKSYLARLNYVHQNAVKHRLVTVANQYPWCSAAWFERTATPAQVKTIYGFKTDKLNVFDEFEPE
jgi:putative transposase